MDPLLAALDETDVKAVLAPFGEERTLPGAAYTDPSVYEWELEHIWRTGWISIGRLADFPPGTATEVTVAGESLIVTSERRLTAVHNVCRHRGHEILQPGEQQSTSSLRCPYHGWVYGLDGALRAAPKMHHRSDLEDVALVDVRIEEWHGWVLVALGDTAAPLDVYIGDLGEHVAPYVPATLVAGDLHSYEVAANWKLIHENYHECYHCPSIHPQLVAVSNPDSGANRSPGGAWVGGSLTFRNGVETLSMDGRSGGRRIEGLPDDLLGEALYVGLIPNLLVSLHPDYVITHRLEPRGEASTIVHCEWLFPDATTADPEFDPAYAIEFWDLTNRQDWAACESLQRGAASAGFRPGVLGSGEDAVYQFLGAIAQTYLGQGLHGIPNPGRR